MQINRPLLSSGSGGGGITYLRCGAPTLVDPIKRMRLHIHPLLQHATRVL